VTLFRADNWLKAPLDRDVIARWTVGGGTGMGYALTMPDLPDPENFTFLAIGDTGDSEASGPHLSPQDAVGREMAADALLPGSRGQGAFVVHTGDIVYMTGEHRLYDRNFRRPYEAFLTPQSTVDDLIFRIPFLPVPGNHDYYDLAGWTRWLARIPILGAGLRAIAHELFAFTIPEGGSEMGKAYMQAFVNAEADTLEKTLPYLPGQQTRLPNRYYRCRMGSVELFALDSNTLEAPPPGTNRDQVHAEAAAHLETLHIRAGELDRELRRHQLTLDRLHKNAQEAASTSPLRQEDILRTAGLVAQVLGELHTALTQVEPAADPCSEAVPAVTKAQRRWEEAVNDLEEADETQEIVQALHALDEASDEACTALRGVENCLGALQEGENRQQVLTARDALQQALHAWTEAVALTPVAETLLVHQLSEEAMDVQRELALERRRLRYRPEDYDSAQLEWLDRSLRQSMEERPDGWRIVYLHHPLYTSIVNHCERPDVQGLRSNLLDLLKGRVHLVLSGHAHAFEWFRSAELPYAGIFVTGGGGQVSLRPSILDPARRRRSRERYSTFCNSGIQEGAVGGRGPTAEDGASGLLYHYLRIEVTPETLVVRPVGIRKVGKAFRREEPMPVYHVPRLPAARPLWNVNRLEGVEVRRDRPPVPRWK
jgi:tetratricopeptide (TPR) repeat protein